MANFVKVATRDELPEGAHKLADIGGMPIAVFRAEGAFYAIDDICTHDGGPLVEGRIEGCVVECPRHGARFDIRTGKALCMPAFEPVRTHQVEVRGEEIWVAVED